LQRYSPKRTRHPFPLRLQRLPILHLRAYLPFIPPLPFLTVLCNFSTVAQRFSHHPTTQTLPSRFPMDRTLVSDVCRLLCRVSTIDPDVTLISLLSPTKLLDALLGSHWRKMYLHIRQVRFRRQLATYWGVLISIAACAYLLIPYFSPHIAQWSELDWWWYRRIFQQCISDTLRSVQREGFCPAYWNMASSYCGHYRRTHRLYGNHDPPIIVLDAVITPHRNHHGHILTYRRLLLPFN
jgi:hypothetical protein